MRILAKLKETAMSVFPVMVIVLLLGFTIVPLEKIMLVRFVVGGIMLILGLTIFLLGVDLGIQPMGERCGAELTKKKNLILLLIAAFAIGFIVTAAEPDIQVFSDQVKRIFSQVNKQAITFVIAAGVGLFIMIGLLRTVMNISIKLTLFISYLILFVIMFFAPSSFVGIAFDSGGATTGPMTVPFIMAMGLGVSQVRQDSENSFGLTGICSVGPVMAVLIYSVVMKNFGLLDAASLECSQAAESAVVSGGILYEIFHPFKMIIGSTICESLISIIPLFALFIVFQISLLKMTGLQVTRIIIGFIYSLIGLTIFLIGVNGGFSQAGSALGKSLGTSALSNGGIWYGILIVIGFAFGAIIVCAEPAVWVLSEQVETVSGGTIKRKSLLVFLSVGTAIAIGLSLLRSLLGFDLKWVLVAGYSLAMILMIFCPSMFSGIAFDSGGVASGPLTSTFILSFTLGAAACGKNAVDSFGVIALVAMMPLIAIQIMGIMFKIKSSKSEENKCITDGGEQ
ncbi:MAG: DUF1538 domain-containing protein [Treponema sp.]|nr:DUF1538 domain-containing protein [Candidatus Treponema merdequi]